MVSMSYRNRKKSIFVGGSLQGTCWKLEPIRTSPIESPVLHVNQLIECIESVDRIHWLFTSFISDTQFDWSQIRVGIYFV